jgi:fructose-1,6-bisphosphatase II
MSSPSLPPLKSATDLERVIEFEFVRATENAALQSVHFMGRGQKERADAIACAAVAGIFDLLDVRAEVVIGEGIKDQAPGLFRGDQLGTWLPGSPRFDIALDPIDGTTNLAKGMPNSISVMAAAQVPEGAPHAMVHLPSYYAAKIAYGPEVKALLAKRGDSPLDMPLPELLNFVAQALGKRPSDLVIMTMDRPRHAFIMEAVRASGAALRMISDGDIAAAVAPSFPDSGIDLYYGIGGSPEGVLTAAALKCLGGGMDLRMWFSDDAQRRELAADLSDAEANKLYRENDLVVGDSALFCATGISDSALLPGVKIKGHRAETHSILMRSRSGTVRHITAMHDLDKKVVPLRPSFVQQAGL